MTFRDFYTRMKEEAQHFQKRIFTHIINVSENYPSSSGHGVASYLKSLMEDRAKAMKVMTESFIQFSVPVTHRYLMCMAENGCNVMPMPNAVEGPRPDSSPLEPLRVPESELVKLKACNGFLQASAIEVRKTLSKFFEYQKRMSDLMTKMDMYMVDDLVPKLSPNTIASYIKWIYTVSLHQRTKCIADRAGPSKRLRRPTDEPVVAGVGEENARTQADAQVWDGGGEA